MRITLAVAGIAVALAAVIHSQPAFAGSTLSFSSSQAASGRGVYQAHCSACHGDHLQGVVGPALAGSASVLKGKTLAFAFNFITKNMPLNAAGSLSHSQYTQIMAYILQQNGHHAGSTALEFRDALRSRARM